MNDPNLQYLAIINSPHASITQILSSDFTFCHQSMLQQIMRGPYISAMIIDTYINAPILVMREIA